jgi:hypothetical protein
MLGEVNADFTGRGAVIGLTIAALAYVLSAWLRERAELERARVERDRLQADLVERAPAGDDDPENPENGTS